MKQNQAQPHPHHAPHPSYPPDDQARSVGLLHAMTHRVADDLRIPEVLNPGQVKPTLVSMNKGDIGYPCLVGSGDGEILIQSIRGNRKIVDRIGSRLLFLKLRATCLHLPTKEFDPVETDSHPLHIK